MKFRFRCAYVVLLLFLSCNVYAQGQNLFFQPPTYPGSGQTVMADFNGDGKPDIVSVDGTVSLGKGDGTFTSGTSWSLPGKLGATAIATGDFNGDGKPDLVVSMSPQQIGPVPAFLYVLLGNGDGTFQPAIAANPAGAVLTQIVVTDVNGDGKADVIGMGPVIVVMLGNGNGTFSSTNTYPLLTCSNSITVGDFNGDHKPDIAIATSGASGGFCSTGLGAVGVLLGNGDGTFQPAVTSTGVNNPDGVVAGDFNRDGKLDLVISDAGTSQTFTLLGKGDGSFQAPSSPVPGGVGVVGAADLNGDGKLDIVVCGLFVGVFSGNGDGTFTAKDTYLSSLSPLNQGLSPDVLLADFNGDGKIDLAVNGAILFGNGDGTFRGNSAISLNAPPLNGPSLGAVTTGDFNGDGIPDLAVAVQGASHNLYILLGDGTGRFSLAHTYALPLSAYSLRAVDLNGDGKLDLLFFAINSPTSWSFEAMLGDGTEGFGVPVASSPQVNTQFSAPVPFAVADFNGDHVPDIAAISAGQVSIFSGNGDGTFGLSANYFAGSTPFSLLTADFNNDGKVDIAVGGSAGIATLLGKGDGTFQSPIFSSGGPVLAAADINGDGNVDIIGDLVFLGNGDGTFTPLPNTNSAIFPQGAVSLVDVNGDGKLDLVDSLGVRVFLGNGDGTFGPPIPIIAPVSSTVGSTLLAIADFNRDGRPDLALVLSLSSPEDGVVTFLNTAPPPSPDFIALASQLVPAMVTPGSSATASVTLTPVGGFSAGVSLSCSGLPSGANCSSRLRPCRAVRARPHLRLARPHPHLWVPILWGSSVPPLASVITGRSR